MASTSQDKMVVSNPRTGCEYERGRLLGKGGFALVYEIRDLKGDVLMADKVGGMSVSVFVL